MMFIRIDTKGTWKDIEHKSCFAGTSLTESDEDINWESGISCYSLENTIEGIENLYKYWTEIARLERTEEYENMQITIFEGEKIDCFGSDGEDMAICTKTIKEIDAVEFMNQLFIAKDKLDGFYENEDGEYEDEISKEEYNSILESLVNYNG